MALSSAPLKQQQVSNQPSISARGVERWHLLRSVFLSSSTNLTFLLERLLYLSWRKRALTLVYS